MFQASRFKLNKTIVHWGRVWRGAVEALLSGSDVLFIYFWLEFNIFIMQSINKLQRLQGVWGSSVRPTASEYDA